MRKKHWQQKHKHKNQRIICPLPLLRIKTSQYWYPSYGILLLEYMYNLFRVTMFDNPTVLKWKIFIEVILKSYAFKANAHKHIPNLKRHLLDCRTLVVVGMLSIG